MVFIVGESLPKRLAASAIDILQKAVYPRKLLPPFSMRRLVGHCQWDLGEIRGLRFEDLGRHFIQHLPEDAGLRPESRILDLGSGCGRVALPLTKFLHAPGYYYGLEVVKPLVQWCRKEITPRFPSFQFIHCDVFNSLYNSEGKGTPETYRFPLDANQFDLIIALSIFTHLLPVAAQNYIAECARVLSPGGRFFGTFYLVENGIRSADGLLNFIHPKQEVALSIDTVIPEHAVAYRSDWLIDTFQHSKMRFLPPVRWGSWTGRYSSHAGQDALLFEKQQ